MADVCWQVASPGPQHKLLYKTQEKQQWMTVNYLCLVGLHTFILSVPAEIIKRVLRRTGAVCFSFVDSVTCVLIRHLCNSMTFTSLAPSTTSKTVHLSIPVHEFLQKELMMDEATEWDPLSWLNGCQMASVGTHLHNLLKLTCTVNINIFSSGRMLNQVNETLLRAGSLCTPSCDTRYLFLAEGRNNESVSLEPVSLFCNTNLSKALSFSHLLSLYLSRSHTHTHLLLVLSESVQFCVLSIVCPLIALSFTSADSSPSVAWWTDMQRIL